MGAVRRTFVAAPITNPSLERAAVPLDTLVDTFAIHCPRPLLDALMAHAKQFRDTEVFGLLLGRAVSMDDNRIRTVVVDYVPATRFLQSRASYVEVSAEELSRMHQACELRMAAENLRIVGWFHTHPGHGIFMSQIDHDNHRLYTHAWQVALVLDPRQEQWGFFIGPMCERVRQDAIVLDATVAGEPASPITAAVVEQPPTEKVAPSLETPSAVMPAVPNGEAATRASDRVEAAVDRVQVQLGHGRIRPVERAWLIVVPSCLVLAGTIGLLIAIGMLSTRLRAQQALLEEDTSRIRDLQLRIEDLSKNVCASR